MAATRESLHAPASHLAARRPDILRTWRGHADQAAELATLTPVSWAHISDHIPRVLDAFEHRLRTESSPTTAKANGELAGSVEEYGSLRWPLGYAPPEALRDWARSQLYLCLLGELEPFAAEQHASSGASLRTEHGALARLCGGGVCERAVRHARAQQLEATRRLKELQIASARLRAGERERAQRWREAAHDLRGTVGVVANAAAVLARSGVSESLRTNVSDALQRGTTSLRELLEDLMDRARLEAGPEERKLVRFDAAAMLKDFCEPLRALAAQRNLFFRTEGVGQLLVEGDVVKIRRITQNLVTNAIKATEHGGVRLTWAERGSADRPQWMLCIQDTGSGLDPKTAASLGLALKRPTDNVNGRDTLAGSFEAAIATSPPSPLLPSRLPDGASRNLGGEGIGLSIVKRLCDLLDASLEVETSAGEGTTFRVIFPRQYCS